MIVFVKDAFARLGFAKAGMIDREQTADKARSLADRADGSGGFRFGIRA
jgi:hypothetical protein